MTSYDLNRRAHSLGLPSPAGCAWLGRRGLSGTREGSRDCQGGELASTSTRSQWLRRIAVRSVRRIIPWGRTAGVPRGGLHGVPVWHIDVQGLKWLLREINELASKGCPVPLFEAAMRRVVIDTNILVVPLPQSAGFCGRLLDLVVDGARDVCVEDRILVENEGVPPRRKFHLPP